MPMLSIFFAVGMVLGGAVLVMLPPAPERGTPVVTRMRVADLAIPCKRTGTANAERGCVAKPAQRQEVAKPAAPTMDTIKAPERFEVASRVERSEVARAQPLPAARPERAASADQTPTLPLPRQRIAGVFEQLPPKVATIASTPAPADSPAVAAVVPLETPRAVVRGKIDAPRIARAASNAAPIQVAATGGNGQRRTITIHPTSQQDVYYYAARRQFAANNSAPPR
jgi:hypothetical protein